MKRHKASNIKFAVTSFMFNVPTVKKYTFLLLFEAKIYHQLIISLGQ